MSIKSAKAFYQRMTEDASFREPFEAEITKEERQKLIKESGYDFTAEEWQQAMTEIQAANSDEELNEEELSDAELTAVSGGANSSILELLELIGNKPSWLITPLYRASSRT